MELNFTLFATMARIHCHYDDVARILDRHYLAWSDNAENMGWCETKECEKQPVLKMSTLIKMQFMTFLNSGTTNNN